MSEDLRNRLEVFIARVETLLEAKLPHLEEMAKRGEVDIDNAYKLIREVQAALKADITDLKVSMAKIAVVSNLVIAVLTAVIVNVIVR